MTHFLFNGPTQAEHTLVLCHGAGAPMDSPFMEQMATLVGAQGIRVARFELPYMVQRREDGSKRPPNRQPVLLESWANAVAALGGPEKLVIGGKSLGGRMASLLAVDTMVRGLVCLGYPFHPPGKPEKLRTAHLADLSVPTLICQGSRDPFGSSEEVGNYQLSPQIRVHWLEDGDHSLKPRKRSGRTAEQNLAEAAAQICEFIMALG